MELSHTLLHVSVSQFVLVNECHTKTVRPQTHVTYIAAALKQTGAATTKYSLADVEVECNKLNSVMKGLAEELVCDESDLQNPDNVDAPGLYYAKLSETSYKLL